MREVITLKRSSCRDMHTKDDGSASGSLTIKFLLLLRLYVPDIEFKNIQWKEISYVVYTI